MLHAIMFTWETTCATKTTLYGCCRHPVGVEKQKHRIYSNLGQALVLILCVILAPSLKKNKCIRLRTLIQDRGEKLN